MSTVRPYVAEEWSARPSARLLNYAIVVMMFLAHMLGATIFDLLQIACEIVLIVLLSVGLMKVRRTAIDMILLGALAATSVASFMANDFQTFALNFKLFLLCILTLTYFRKVRFLPRRLISAFFVINAALIVHQYLTGQFLFPVAAYFGFYQSYVNDRPIGLFLTPHASSYFIAIWLLYTFHARPVVGLSSGVLMAMTATLTNVAGVMAQLVDYLLRRFRAYRLSLGKVPLFTFILIPLTAVFFLIDPFMELIRIDSYFRYYSVEIILPQLFSPRYFAEALRLIPANYGDLTVMQEATYGDYGNEIGLIKLFVEGGLVLGALTLWAILREVKAYRVLIWISLLHYAFAINTPFFLFLMIAYNREMMYPQTVPAGAPALPVGDRSPAVLSPAAGPG